MTPEEAVAELLKQGLIVRQWVEVQLILDAVKHTETRRCAAMTIELAISADQEIDFSGSEDVTDMLHAHAKNILTTGGLKVES